MQQKDPVEYKSSASFFRKCKYREVEHIQVYEKPTNLVLAKTHKKEEDYDAGLKGILYRSDNTKLRRVCMFACTSFPRSGLSICVCVYLSGSLHKRSIVERSRTT